MTDLDQEMYYTWTDATDVTYTNWAYYEPNNSGDEDCVEMWLERVSQGGTQFRRSYGDMPQTSDIKISLLVYQWPLIKC